jgi:hypothetical protein
VASHCWPCRSGSRCGSPGRQIDPALFIDAWSGSDGRGRPVVIPKEIAGNWIVLGDEHSYDVALLDIGLNLAALIAAGHFVAVHEREWSNPPARFDFHFLLGTPTEMVTSNERRQTGPNGADVRHLPTVMALKRAIVELNETERHEYAAVTEHNRFYGKLVDVPGAFKVDQIDGGKRRPDFRMREKWRWLHPSPHRHAERLEEKGQNHHG